MTDIPRIYTNKFNNRPVTLSYLRVELDCNKDCNKSVKNLYIPEGDNRKRPYGDRTWKI